MSQQYPLQLHSTLVTIAAPFSLFGSLAMLYVISRSRSKLSTTLNRLLVGLCVGDIIFSFPMLFSKAIITFEDDWESIDPSDGLLVVIVQQAYPESNNQAACSTQGFFITLGMVIGPLNNCALCIYYICVVKLNMSVVKIKKKVEPFLHAIPWMYAIIIPSIAVATRSINPDYSMCLINVYRPEGCESDDCVIGKDRVKKLFFIQTALLLFAFIAIIAMMTVIFLKVWRQERRMRNAGYRSTNAARAAGNEVNMIAGNRNQAQASNGLLRQNVANSRKVLNQAMAYAGAYFATWFFFVYYLLNTAVNQNPMPEIMLVLAATCSPLQGFFNFLVFVYPRVTQQLRGNDDMNVLQALCAAIRCIPIPPRNRRNRGVGNGAAAGTATGRGGNGNVGGNRATGNTAATTYESRNISGLTGTAVGAGNAAANLPRLEPNDSRLSNTDSTTDIKISRTVHGGIDDKMEQRMHNASGTESLAILSQHTAVSTANASFYSIGEVGDGESQIEEEMEQEKKTEIEERMTIADEEVGMLDTVAESYPMEGEQIKGNDDIDKDEDEETGVLKNDVALEPW
mmetsp:Transcript_17526/g.26239  ORF Transcript_17526/g.26239 Transcript_17526/m.26239 type:complete len:569 (+) Transcript_17526:108-1814(+)